MKMKMPTEAEQKLPKHSVSDGAPVAGAASGLIRLIYLFILILE